MAGGAEEEPGGEIEGSAGSAEGPGYWAEKFDLIRAEYGWIPDEDIQEIKYFRFCQTMDAIYKRIDSERKYKIMVQEGTTRFLASIIASTVHWTDEGRFAVTKTISEFSIFDSPKEQKKPKKKELPVGGYEQAMSFFSGMERK